MSKAKLTSLDVNQVGTVGEYLVTTMLLADGYDAHRVDTVGYDVLLRLDGRHHRCNDGLAVRIDVKTTAKAKDYYQFTIKKGQKNKFRNHISSDCDLLAFVCLESMNVLFVLSDDCDGKEKYSISRAKFDEACPYESLYECLDSL